LEVGHVVGIFLKEVYLFRDVKWKKERDKVALFFTLSFLEEEKRLTKW